MPKACFRSQADESRTLPQRAGARRGFAATPRTNAACLFRRKRLWSLIFKLCSFLIRVCSVFPCCHCLLCLFEGREGVLFIQGGGRGGGWRCNLCGTQSGLSHGLPQCPQALWPALASLFVTRSIELSASMPGLLCLLGFFVVASLDVVLSVRLSSRPLQGHFD